MKKSPIALFAALAFAVCFEAGCSTAPSVRSIGSRSGARKSSVHTFAIVASTADQSKLSNEQFETARNKLVVALAANGQVLVSDPAEADYIIEIAPPELAGVPIVTLRANPLLRQRAAAYASAYSYSSTPSFSYTGYNTTSWNGYGAYDPFYNDYGSTGGYVTPISTTPPSVVVTPPNRPGHPSHPGNPVDCPPGNDGGNRHWPVNPNQPPLPVNCEPPTHHRPPTYVDNASSIAPSPADSPAPTSHRIWGSQSSSNSSYSNSSFGNSSYDSGSSSSYTPPARSEPSYSGAPLTPSSSSSFSGPSQSYSPPAQSYSAPEPSFSSSSSSSSSSYSPPAPVSETRDNLVSQPN